MARVVLHFVSLFIFISSPGRKSAPGSDLAPFHLARAQPTLRPPPRAYGPPPRLLLPTPGATGHSGTGLGGPVPPAKPAAGEPPVRRLRARATSGAGAAQYLRWPPTLWA